MPFHLHLWLLAPKLFSILHSKLKSSISVSCEVVPLAVQWLLKANFSNTDPRHACFTTTSSRKMATTFFVLSTNLRRILPGGVLTSKINPSLDLLTTFSLGHYKETFMFMKIILRNLYGPLSSVNLRLFLLLIMNSFNVIYGWSLMWVLSWNMLKLALP